MPRRLIPFAGLHAWTRHHLECLGHNTCCCRIICPYTAIRQLSSDLEVFLHAENLSAKREHPTSKARKMSSLICLLTRRFCCIPGRYIEFGHSKNVVTGLGHGPEQELLLDRGDRILVHGFVLLNLPA